jgi:hypothetical protein
MPAKMANFRLAFDARAKKLFDGFDKLRAKVPKLQIFRLDFCAALRHHAANSRDMVTSEAWRGNIGRGEGLSLA